MQTKGIAMESMAHRVTERWSMGTYDFCDVNLTVETRKESISIPSHQPENFRHLQSYRSLVDFLLAPQVMSLVRSNSTHPNSQASSLLESPVSDVVDMVWSSYNAGRYI